MKDGNNIGVKAKLVRKWCLLSTTEAGSGHPTSCLSAADLMTVLFEKYFSYDLKNPLNPNNDRLIFSKGHGAPLFYTMFALSGAFDPKELLTLRKYKSRLEGHPTPEFTYTDAATGSLGQGLSVGCGLALALQKENGRWKMQDRQLPKVYVLLGDGEMAEGSVWEAANFASFYKLNNLIAILDMNKYGQSQETMFGHDIEEYHTRFSAFNWEVLLIDGHNLTEIDSAFKLAVNNKSEKPFVIIAKTKKGKGVSLLEDKDGWHGKALKKEELEKAFEELGEIDESLRFKLKTPNNVILASEARPESDPGQARMTEEVHYKLGDQVATREVYGEALAQLANNNPDIYSLDGDVKNSTYSQDFKKIHPDRFIECFIAEQNMVGVAIGMQRLGKIPFVSTFAAFFTRAFDQIRMAGISKANIKFVGSHAGVSIGEDGPSQMGLEDIAMFGALPETVILHPSDAVSTAKLLPQLVEHYGISYLRTLRPKTPVIYNAKETFAIGGSKILKQSNKDLLTIVACGITVHEASKAYEDLKKQKIMIRVVDCYSLKPIDHKTIIECTRTTQLNTIITVEDHFSHGGLGDFVQSAVSGTGACVVKLAVDHFSRSGSPSELLKDAGIDSEQIVKTVKLSAG